MTDLRPAPSVSRMRFSFHLPLQKEYVVPARCSSCDGELGVGAVTYPLRLESEGKTERFGTIIPMPLCGHCHRRRTWERAGAFIGMLFGGLAILVLFPALRAIHPLLGVISAIIFFIRGCHRVFHYLDAGLRPARRPAALRQRAVLPPARQ
jgi:hypothetical protein